jgi:hypothetical protein
MDTRRSQSVPHTSQIFNSTRKSFILCVLQGVRSPRRASWFALVGGARRLLRRGRRPGNSVCGSVGFVDPRRYVVFPVPGTYLPPLQPVSILPGLLFVPLGSFWGMASRL